MTRAAPSLASPAVGARFGSLLLALPVLLAIAQPGAGLRLALAQVERLALRPSRHAGGGASGTLRLRRARLADAARWRAALRRTRLSERLRRSAPRGRGAQ